MKFRIFIFCNSLNGLVNYENDFISIIFIHHFFSKNVVRFWLTGGTNLKTVVEIFPTMQKEALITLVSTGSKTFSLLGSLWRRS